LKHYALTSYLFLMLLVFGVCMSAFALEDAYSLRQVRELLKVPPGISSSFDEKAGQRLGDRMAIALLKIYSQDQLKEPANARRCITLLEEAFSSPAAISAHEDRRPDVTLILLTFLRTNTVDESLEKEILNFETKLRNI